MLSVNWADTFGTANAEYAYDVEVGPDGSAYVAGSFRDGTTIDFDDQHDGGEITSPATKGNQRFAHSDGFLVKYDQNGGFQWAVHAANEEDYASINSVSLDSQGSAYIVGHFETGMALYRNDVLQATVTETVNRGSYEVFIAKVSRSGNVEWLEAIGGEGSQSAHNIEVLEDPSNGNVELIVSGKTYAGGNADTYGFVGKYAFNESTDSLNLSWMQTQRLVDASVWLNETDVSENQFVGVGQIDANTAYIGIFDSATGQLLEETLTPSVAFFGGVDRIGNDLYISGTFTASVDLDGNGTIDLVGGETRRGFIAKYEYDPTLPTGEQLNVSWASVLMGSAETLLSDVKISPAGGVHAVGRFVETVSVDGIELQSVGAYDGISVVLDPMTGSFLRADRFGGSGDENPRILQVGVNGAIYVTGYIGSTDATFPNVSGTFASAGGDDGFIAVYTPVTSAPPVADAGPPQFGDEDQSILFDASGSTDPDGDPFTYRWDFGDGETAETTSPTIAHAYAYGGTFDVALTVLDGNGGVDSDTTTATVTEVDDVPVADAGGPYTGFATEAVTFDASATFDFDNADATADNDQTLSYIWDFGDGGTASTPSDTVAHTYAAPGLYDVALTVSDGDASSTVTTTASIEAAPAGDASTIYVWDIQDSFESRQRGRSTDYRLVIDVRRDSDADGVAEATDAGAAGVAVSVELTDTSGQVLTFTGITDSQGIFRSEWIRGLSPDTYRAEVVDLAIAGFTWDPFDVLDATANDDDADFDGAPDQLLTI